MGKIDELKTGKNQEGQSPDGAFESPRDVVVVSFVLDGDVGEICRDLKSQFPSAGQIYSDNRNRKSTGVRVLTVSVPGNDVSEVSSWLKSAGATDIKDSKSPERILGISGAIGADLKGAVGDLDGSWFK